MGKGWLDVHFSVRRECLQDCEDSEHDTFEELSAGQSSRCRVVRGKAGRIGN